MAGAAVTIFLENLSELEIYYPDLISGAEKELRQLKNDIYLLEAFLQDEVKKQNDEGSLQMQRQIKEVVYEVEDAIDACLVRPAAAAKTKITTLLRRTDSKRFSLAKEIKSLREGKVRELLHKIKDYNSSDKVSDAISTSVAARRRSRLMTADQQMRKNRVVGLEDEEETITGHLMESNEKLDVISIIGMPGIGKTTLARKIYGNERIAYEFPIRIWVRVSQKFKNKDVCLCILKSFTSEDMSSLTEEELSETVSACLKDEKFLLVLDDVWSPDDWKAIKQILPADSNGVGKVLITSRHSHVAGEHGKSHDKRFLREEESWELLQLEVFGNSKLVDCHSELEEVGKYIAGQCGGLPLQIVAVARILGDQLTIIEWEKVSLNMKLLLHSETRLSNMMELTYSMLPDELRECFLYMGVFPEDFEITVWTLTRLWIAEGFVQPAEGKSLEEIATQNLEHLIGRNLVMADKINFMGEVKTCRLHDMMRAFCITKAMEQNLFQDIKKSKTTGALEPPVSEVQKFHRLCFHSDVSKFLSETQDGPQVRSFLCFYEQPVQLEPEYISKIPNSFSKLRILESKSINLDQFPASFTKLIHLRYLTLYIDALKILPEPITQLWNLQTLVVETKSHSITMKANMWRMIRLRYLKTKAAILLDNKWEGEAGQNLHTLTRLLPESCTEVVSEKAKNLKTLGISGKLANIFKSKFLQNLHHLEKLKLVNSLTYEPIDEDMLPGLPQLNCFPSNLKRLTLTNTFLGWQHVSALANIKTLEALKLKHNAFVGDSWKVSGYNFPNLQLLLIVNTDLVIWEASTESFPNLRFLVVKSCENLKEIPECLGTHLEKLEIDRLRRSAVESARIIGEKKKEKPEGKFAVPFILNIGAVC